MCLNSHFRKHKQLQTQWP